MARLLLEEARVPELLARIGGKRPVPRGPSELHAARSGARMNGYDDFADEFMSVRSGTIGVAPVRAWARELPAGARVLDMGCGHGIPIARELSRLGPGAVTARMPCSRDRHILAPRPGVPGERPGGFG